MTKPEPIPTATYEPQGSCPNAWVARIDGIPLTAGGGGIRRYSTEAAALKKAQHVIQDRVQREGGKP